MGAEGLLVPSLPNNWESSVVSCCNTWKFRDASLSPVYCIYQYMLPKARDGVCMLQFPVHDVWAVFFHNTGYAYLNNQCHSTSHLNSSVSLTNYTLIKHGSVAPNPFTTGTDKSILDYCSIWLENSEIKQGLEARL